MSVPLYLAEPTTTGHLYGSVWYERRTASYVIRAEPAVMEMAKRVFPGSAARDGSLRFKATRRAVGDLNWLMLRFPLEIKNPARFAEDRNKALAHAARRDTNHRLAPAAPPPTLQGELFPYQAEAVSFLLANERTLLADDMGLGKTVTALAALAAAEAFPAIVVVPTNVQRQWQSMAGAWLNMPTPGQALWWETSEDRGKRLCHIVKGLRPYEIPKVPITIIHYGLLRGWKNVLPELGYRAVVFDEVQELRHTGTEKYSAASLLAGSTQYAWGLSGTPIYNYGIEFWAVSNILDYHCLGDSDSFTREWCTGYGSKQVAKPDVLGDYLRREGLMLRRRKGDVQKQLPPKRRTPVQVDNDASKYNALIAEAVKLAHRYDQITDWHERGHTKRRIGEEARQATGVAKAPYVAEFVKTLLEAGERVLLYAHHHAVHDALAEELAQWHPARITGRETHGEKEAAIQAFAGGRTNLVQLAIRGAAGLDGLQGSGTCVVFAELDWSPAVHTQCEDRLHRIGVDKSLESILCYYLVSDTGSDETMQQALGLKIGQFVGLMGDRAESDQDRALADQAVQRHLDTIIDRLKRIGRPT